MENVDLLKSLIIYSRARHPMGAGIWVDGRIAEHTFTALVFAAHAHDPANEMDGSRISKFELRTNDDRTIVANFDRGWDIIPSTPIANQIVDLLCARLAKKMFGQ